MHWSPGAVSDEKGLSDHGGRRVEFQPPRADPLASGSNNIADRARRIVAMGHCDGLMVNGNFTNAKRSGSARNL
ncbi:hypothetical protein BIWAKO_02420 [Bosea sp. BIWAKO-01]|nr:hypothetical protein BIWAKO_02420 [Bosea sp. BIWAKO-01]